MAETLKDFGVQWPLLLASILNFFILLYLLKRFLYGPILKVLDERKDIIDKSLENARKIEEDKKLTEERLKNSLRLANEQALRTIDQAKEVAAKTKDELIKEAGQQAKQIIERAKIEITQEKEAAQKAIRQETARLIAQSVEKVVAEIRTPELDENLINGALEKVDGQV